MNAARRLRWLPRFSIGNLLMLMVVVGLCLARYDQRRKLDEQAERMEALQREIARLSVHNILLSNRPDDEKAQELARFIRLGDRYESLGRWLGSDRATERRGSLWLTTYYDCGLVVQYDDGDLIRGVGYCKAREHQRRPDGSYYAFDLNTPRIDSRYPHWLMRESGDQ
jgi:hypothetical protein